MKRFLFALLLPFLGACLDFEEAAHDRDLARRGLDKEYLNGPPPDNEVRARIVGDVRRDRMLELHLDEGTPTCAGIRYDEMKPMCAKDQTALKVFTIHADSADRQYPVQEIAYYCPTEDVYYYHYLGGEGGRDVWLGPYSARLKRSGPPKD